MSRFDDPADDRRTPFDERLAELLGRTAQSARPNPDLARQVRQRLSAGDAPGRAPRRLGGGMPSLGAVAGSAVAALLLVAFVWVFAAHGWTGFRLGGGTGAPANSPTKTATSTAANCVNNAVFSLRAPTPKNPVDHSVALGESATSHGITVTLDRVYSDATGTTVTYSTTPDKGYQAKEPVLIDASGARYIALASNGSLQSNGHYLDTLLFAPLPQSELGSTQRLTFSLTGLRDINVPAGEGAPLPTIQGAWNILFSVTPVAGKAFPLSLPSQTHNGITITLEEMDVAPVGGGLNGQDGGLRVRYLVSGLPPSTRALAAAVNYPTAFTDLVGSSASSAGGEACYDTLIATLASGQKLIPGFILLAGPDAPTSTADLRAERTRTVGASGAVEVEALFYTAIPAGKTTIAINTFTLMEMRAGKQVFLRNAQGPWAFTVTLPK